MKSNVKKPASPGRVNRRSQIVAATEKLLRTRGLANATTRAIAEEAGCSEGAIYVHFRNRMELLMAVLEESLPDMLAPLRALEQATGTATPQENLQRALAAVHAFHCRVIPGLCALFSEPALLAEYRKSLSDRNRGPQGAIGRLRRYIAAEQKIGRINQAVDSETAATCLMANSFFHSFTGLFLGSTTPFGPFCSQFIAMVLDR